MTSLELFKKVDINKTVPPDWGTGRHGLDDIWISRAPTWQTTGLPLDHHYQLTALKLSNVRDNDELVPRPQGNDMSRKLINQPFPGEHPYTSHMEKFAFIPKFDSPQDPKRGVAARQIQPLSDEMPANAYNVTVVKKIKGFPYREEIQALPTEGKKEPLYWQGEHYFDQQSKIHGNRQQFYPIPPKQTAPNLQDRPADLKVSERSANVLRNIERNQWIPSHKLDYTGLGPANPMALDNLECKKAVFYQTGDWDEKLYPRSVNTFDPARSMEGRLRKLFAPKPPQQIMIESGTSANLSYQRKMTLTEREEDRLLNGKDYVNLPAESNDPLKDKRWQELDRSSRAEPNLERVQTAQAAAQEEEQDEFEVPDRSNSSEDKLDYLVRQKEEMHKSVQGMEARNRWKLLENSTPDHDISQLKEKYKMLNDKEQPTTFYRHEGRYNEERAGLYKTSYDPERLTYSMNAQQLSGGNLFNTSNSHVNANLYPTIPWDENEAALKRSKTVVFKNSELSGDRPSTADMLNPYRETVALQRAALQHNVATSRPRVQDGEFVLREDTMGDSYNTNKFLQGNKLDRNIRIEPTNVISHENQNLERTRQMVAPRQLVKSQLKNKSVHFSDNVHIQNVYENMPVHIGDSHTKPLSNIEEDELRCAFGNFKASSKSYTETHPQQMKPTACPNEFVVGDTRNLAENLHRPVPVPTVVCRNTEPIVKPATVNFTRDSQRKPLPISETADEFSSLSTNFMPVGMSYESPMRSSYASQYPVYDLSEKKDLRFSWEPGTGQLRPQSCLLDLQNSFIKSEVRKKFHRTYPEINPEIRMNINTGKKHSFFGMNAQVIHG
ncbi:hypothetical protein PoB_002687400 [Plakobranchus ocellatus]|uniref:Zasp-like motif domain-containing protein n=1 Tax=Plakobranchus ocellatus TaxID=259542 RepID=A0AAV4A1B0_9GAST|nr:hypothetical protein PoB_002687400 [Plakobranchus ocellatus]